MKPPTASPSSANTGQRLKPDASILIVQANRLGDCVLSIPSIRLLRRSYPQARISVLYRPDTAGAFYDLVPEMDNLVKWYPQTEHRGMAGRLAMMNLLRRNRYDAAICSYAPPSLLWILRGSRIPVRVTRHTVNLNRYYWGNVLCNRIVQQDRNDGRLHEAEYNIELLGAIGIPFEIVRPGLAIPDAAHAFVAQLLESNGVTVGDGLAVLHPGYGANRPPWKSENWAAVGDSLAAVGAKVILTGGKSEREMTETVRTAMSESALNLAGALGIVELAALHARSRVHVSVSTGPMHIAAAAGTPVVELVGQANQRAMFHRWYPYGTDFIAVHSSAVCPHCIPPDCKPVSGVTACVDGLPLEKVISAAVALYSGSDHPDKVNWADKVAPQHVQQKTPRI